MNESVNDIIDPIYQTQWDMGAARNECLAQFFDSQVQAGVIESSIVADIADSKTFGLENGGHFRLQMNPGRVTRGISSIPHPSPLHTIAFQGGVPCFCCPDVIRYQWPNERGIRIHLNQNPAIILPNIAPIFRPHFTVVSPDHRPQIMDWAGAVSLAEQVPRAWVIQNGPDAGATNPWHYHLQLFFSDLPIQSAPRQALSGTLAQLSHPALILAITENSAAAFLEQLTLMGNNYLALGDTRRINLLIQMTPTHWTGYLVLRDTRFKTSLYRSGQPGYAEPAGIISATGADSYLQWTTDGVNRYQQLMTDIRPTDLSTIDFLSRLS